MLLLDATLTDMAAQQMTTLEVVGMIVRDELARAGYRFRDTDRTGVPKGTLSNISAGKPVQERTYRRVEVALGMPTRFLTYVADGDVDKIKRLPGRDADPAFGLREDLRSYTLEALADIKRAKAATRRRAQ